MEKMKWLVIHYNLPAEPSRHRVSIWRRLKKLGATNIQQSMWVLPNIGENYNALQKISRDIEFNNGEALLMGSMFFQEKHEERVVSLLNKIRDEEYEELINECENYIKEIEKMISKEEFTYAELEKEEEELEKLISWQGKIEARDMFHSSEATCVKEMLEIIKRSFEEYGELVYKHNNE